MQKVEQQQLFDYASLDNETRVFVQEKAQSIHARLKRTAEDVITIGLDLIAVKARLGHGQFLSWMKSEFDMTEMSAVRFMQVAKRFGNKSNIMLDLPITILYALAAPSTPDVVIEMVETRQIEPTLSAIREAKREAQIVEEHKAALNGYRGYERWQQAEEWEKKQRELEQQEEIKPSANDEPVTEYATIDDIFPGYSAWKTQQTPLVASTAIPVSPFTDDVDEEEEYEETEEDRYLSAVDNGTVEYYYDDLRREAIQRDKDERAQRQGLPPALTSSESNEWYTPAQYVEAARQLMGGIDVDPASNATANKIIKALTYYDIESNGLDKPWYGRVWLNPPYGRDNGGSNQEVWSHRLLEQYETGITKEAVLLVNANTEAKWFQPFYDYLICLTNHRIKFYSTDGTPNQPTQGNALIYLGHQQERFIEIFKQFGRIVKAVD